MITTTTITITTVTTLTTTSTATTTTRTEIEQIPLREEKTERHTVVTSPHIFWSCEQALWEVQNWGWRMFPHWV